MPCLTTETTPNNRILDTLSLDNHQEDSNRVYTYSEVTFSVTDGREVRCRLEVVTTGHNNVEDRL